MTPSEGDQDNRGPRIAGTIDGDLQPCWQCGRTMSQRALFCHACGTLQPPRDIDHFARLGLERRFDIDLDQLERQRAGFTRALDPARFTARGARQQTYARQQAEALAAAHEALREPVRRAHYLLDLAGIDRAKPGPESERLSADLATASDAAALDRLGALAARRTAESVGELATAFRRGRLTEAAEVLARLEAFESIAAQTRHRRANLPPGPPAP